MLRILHNDIGARVDAMVRDAGGWPCRKGCDFCCRNLASPPAVTRAEWELLAGYIARMPSRQRQQIGLRMRESSRICPLLDRDTGECAAYAARPVACRTYGFYIDRDKGLYCRQIESAVERGEHREVIWGNYAGVAAAVARLGPQKDLLSWWAEAGFDKTTDGEPVAIAEAANSTSEIHTRSAQNR